MECFQVSLGCGPIARLKGILPSKKIEISMLKDAMTGHLTRSSGTDPRNLLTSRQPGHQSPAAASTEPVPETAQFPGF